MDEVEYVEEKEDKKQEDKDEEQSEQKYEDESEEEEDEEYSRQDNRKKGDDNGKKEARDSEISEESSSEEDDEEEEDYHGYYRHEEQKKDEEEEIRMRERPPKYTSADHEAQRNKMEKDQVTKSQLQAEEEIKDVLHRFNKEDEKQEDTSMSIKEFWDEINTKYHPEKMNPNSDYLFHMIPYFDNHIGELSYSLNTLKFKTKKMINRGLNAKKYESTRTVDISKISQPSDDTLLRNLSHASVTTIEELLKKNPWDERRPIKCLAYRKVGELSFQDVWKEMKEADDFILYAIDGNHTRAALSWLSI